MADMLTGWDLASAEMACRGRVWVCRRPKGRAWERHCQLPGFSEMYGLGARRTRLWRQQAEGRTREVLQIESNAERAENGEMRRHCAARHAFLLPVPGAESFAGSNCCQNQSRQIPFGEWNPGQCGSLTPQTPNLHYRAECHSVGRTVEVLCCFDAGSVIRAQC